MLDPKLITNNVRIQTLAYGRIRGSFGLHPQLLPAIRPIRSNRVLQKPESSNKKVWTYWEFKIASMTDAQIFLSEKETKR